MNASLTYNNVSCEFDVKNENLLAPLPISQKSTQSTSNSGIKIKESSSPITPPEGLHRICNTQDETFYSGDSHSYFEREEFSFCFDRDKRQALFYCPEETPRSSFYFKLLVRMTMRELHLNKGLTYLSGFLVEINGNNILVGGIPWVGKEFCLKKILKLTPYPVHALNVLLDDKGRVVANIPVGYTRNADDAFRSKVKESFCKPKAVSAFCSVRRWYARESQFVKASPETIIEEFEAGNESITELLSEKQQKSLSIAYNQLIPKFPSYHLRVGDDRKQFREGLQNL